MDPTLDALREWQREGAPFQLHPGDVGWARRLGGDPVRTWHRDGRVVAVGLADGPVLRLTVAPDLRRDEQLAARLVADVRADAVEVPADALVRDRLAEAGWGTGEPWTPLTRDLTGPVPDPGVRVEVVGPERVADRVAVQRAAFENSTFTAGAWHLMAAGPAYADARCLVAYDGAGAAVAAVTVWSAGPGRPGLLEPMGVHRDHRGRGYGTAISLAAAAALRELGASGALVCTPSANAGGVRTYEAAGFERRPEVSDRVRPT